MRTTLITLAVLLLAALVGGFAFIRGGLYNISALAQHTQPVYSLLGKTMHFSVRARADEIEVPRLDDPAQIERGGVCYVSHCVQCHGGPGVAQDPIGRSMLPLPGPLVEASGKWRPQDLYWITRNGIKMSGMPSWRFTMAEADLWAVVAFMQRLPALNAAQFRTLAERRAAARCDREDEAEPTQRVDADRGRLALAQYACSACHSIPGVVGPEAHVGPPLGGFATRQLIAGSVANTPEMLVRWIRDPRSIDPLTTMPAMGVGERDARDIAAYLGTLH